MIKILWFSNFKESLNCYSAKNRTIFLFMQVASRVNHSHFVSKSIFYTSTIIYVHVRIPKYMFYRNTSIVAMLSFIVLVRGICISKSSVVIFLINSLTVIFDALGAAPGSPRRAEKMAELNYSIDVFFYQLTLLQNTFK